MPFKPNPIVTAMTTIPRTFAHRRFVCAPMISLAFITQSKKMATMGSNNPFATCANKMTCVGLKPSDEKTTPLTSTNNQIKRNFLPRKL